MVDFSELKKNNLMELAKKAENAASGTVQNSYDSVDERFWQPTADKAGNGVAVFRFLPAPAVDGAGADPWAFVPNHGFEGPDGWYIEECPKAIGKQCPVCEANNELWKAGDETSVALARKRGMRKYYVSNIYIISDPANPENEGKVFLFKYGKTIYDKIMYKMNPPKDDNGNLIDPDDVAINPFNLWEGANFKLKFSKVGGYRNYDKSSFSDPSALSDDDDKLEKIWRSEYSLKELKAEDKYKSYDELKTRFDKISGLGEPEFVGNARQEVEKTFEKRQQVSEEPKQQPKAASKADDDFDDDLDYFNSLASED
jgi:hypothetical protein